ncbi:MAG TPA: hypothetical protein VF633_13195 [Brevundimonas sp.]
MLISLILSAALQATAPADAIGEFRALCLATAGDANRVAATVIERGGWNTPARTGDLFIWSRLDDPTTTLITGVQQGRVVCMLKKPEIVNVEAALAAGLGPHFGAVGDSGLHVFAPSAEAFAARDLTFIQTANADGHTTLTAIRPPR